MQHVRLWVNSTSIDFDYTVGPINFYDGWGKEVVAQYGSGLATNATWWTDSNLRDSVVRVRDHRFSWNYTVNQNISGNYAPVRPGSEVPIYSSTLMSSATSFIAG